MCSVHVDGTGKSIVPIGALGCKRLSGGRSIPHCGVDSEVEDEDSEHDLAQLPYEHQPRVQILNIS